LRLNDEWRRSSYNRKEKDGKMMKCIYGRQPCMFLKKNACPRENQCLFAGELKTRMKLKKKKRGAASGQRSSPRPL
jgi:hypothetical protein